MNVLRKVLNKLNGNLCFSAESDANYYIFECDRTNEAVSYTISSKHIKDVCAGSLNNYFVCFGDDQIGLFNGTTLNESYANVASLTVDLMIYGKTPIADNNFYIWSKSDNSISRVQMVGAVTSVIWTADLPYDFTACRDAEIFYKKDNDLIIFKGLGRILSFRDLNTYAALIGETSIDTNSFASVSGNKYPYTTYARTRQVWGKELEVSSSSSTSSSSSSTSLSSMSSESIGNTTSSSSSSSTSSESLSSMSSESIGNTSSSSSSIYTSTSSESSGAFQEEYCVTGCYTVDADGTYFRAHQYRYEHPVYTNGLTYMFMHVYDGTLEWVIDYVVNDGTPGITYKLVTTQTPDGSDWYDGVLVSQGECSSSSSSTSSSSSESSSVYHTYYCVSGSAPVGSDGTYYKTEAHFRNRPVWTNGSYYMYYHYYTPLTTYEWAIDTSVIDDNPGVNWNWTDTMGDAPDTSTWNSGTVVEGVCP